MQHIKILNNIEHANFHVITQKRAEFGDNQMCVSITLSEMRNAQQDYPLVFYAEAASQQFHPMALFGFQKHENLFLSSGQWHDAYLPALMKKGPFSIGRQLTSDGQEHFVMSIDESDPRISSHEGEPLFLSHGGASDYTLNIAECLNRLQEEQSITQAFTQYLHEHGLLVPLNIEFEQSKEENVKLTGFYTIDEEKLTQLSPEQLSQMAKLGYLHGAYFAISSLSNIAKLIKMKQTLSTCYAQN